jgi:hypothetical protein
MPTYIARHPMTASRELGDEMIVISAGDSRLFTLNDPGAAIWKAADGVTPLADIVARTICAEYDVRPDEALSDVEAFVTDLVGQGVMLSSDRPIGAASTEAP